MAEILKRRLRKLVGMPNTDTDIVVSIDKIYTREGFAQVGGSEGCPLRIRQCLDIADMPERRLRKLGVCTVIILIYKSYRYIDKDKLVRLWGICHALNTIYRYYRWYGL